MPRCLCAVVASLACAAFAAGTPVPTLYAIERDGSLHTVDPLTAAVLTSVEVTLEGYEIRSCNALARHPATGALYASLRASLAADGSELNFLATLDPMTGAGTVVGDLNDRFAGLAFLPDGVLMGVTGDGADQAETLYRINTATAATTLVTELGNGDDGEALAVGPGGAVFHASGRGANDEFFERINFGAFAGLTDILPSHSYGVGGEGILALAWSSALGKMFGVDYSAEELFTIDLTTGARTTVDAVGRTIKGLVFDGATLYALENHRSPPILNTLDPETGDVLTQTNVSLPGRDLDGATGLARQPVTGTFFAILRDENSQQRLLVTLDPGSGEATLVGELGDKFAGLAFRSDGALLGVTGFGAEVAKSLYLLNTSTAAATFLRALPNGVGGEQAIATAPNGFLYHAAGYEDGFQYFERMDPFVSTPPLLTDIPHHSQHVFVFPGPGAGAPRLSSPQAMGWSTALNKMFITAEFTHLYSVGISSPASFTFEAQVGEHAKGIAFDGATCYLASSDYGELRAVDPTTGATLNHVPVTLPGAIVYSLRGLARNPIDGKLYVIVLDDDFGGFKARHLCTVNPATGDATLIGTLPRFFEGLAFRADGTLIGVTESDFTGPAGLYILDKTNASATFLMNLFNGGSGEQAIAIAPNGFLYRAAGLEAGDQFLERIDLDALTIDVIATPGSAHSFPYEEASALGFSPGLNAMYYSDLEGDLWTIHPATGDTTFVGSMLPVDGVTFIMKGLAFDEAILAPCPGDTNGDRVVDFIDLNIVLSAFGHSQGQPAFLPGADLDGDGDVDFIDLNVLLSYFGVSC